MSFVFNGVSSLIELDVSSWDVSNVTNMMGIFLGTTSLKYLDVSNWDVSNVEYMNLAFWNASSLTSLDVRNWDVGKVDSAIGMFEGASGITSLDVSKWDVSNIRYMDSMFRRTASLSSLDVSAWDVSNVLEMRGLFNGASSLTSLDLSNWDMSNVTSTWDMFYNVSSLVSIDLSNVDLSNVTEMSDMFHGVDSLRELKLGEKSILNLASNTSTIFTSPFKGNWIKKDDRSIGYSDLSTLLSDYDGSVAGTYIRDRTFDVVFNNDSTLEVVLVDYNGIFTKPTNPTYANHAFAGWYTDSSFTTEYDFSTAATSDITVYAKWDIDTFTITFDSLGGSNVISETVDYNGLFTKPANPTYANHTFAGWYTDQSFTTEYDFSTAATSDITVYAK